MKQYLLVLITTAIALFLPRCELKYDNPCEYLIDYFSAADENAYKAFGEIAALDKNAIPLLLKHGLDERIIHISIAHPICSSNSPTEEEMRLTVGTVCLYLVESIKTGIKTHSKPHIVYPEQRPEAKMDYWATRNKYAITNQKRAYEAYLGWWESVKDSKTLLKDLNEIVPWDEYLDDVYAPKALGIENPEALIKLFNDPNPHIRRLAVKALRMTKNQQTVPAVIEMLKDTDARVRLAAVARLGVWKSNDAIPAITDILQDEDEFVRRQAIIALKDLDARNALPEIIKRIDDPESEVRFMAISTVGDWGVKETIPLLINKLNDENKIVRSHAVSALGKLDAQNAIPHIIGMLDDKESWVRENAVEALGRLKAKEALPEIIKRLDDDFFVEQDAIIAIEQIDAQDKKSVSVLLKRLESGDSRARWTALILLGRLGAGEAIPQIIKALNDRDFQNRREAVLTLGKLDARQTAPEIRKCLKDKDESVRIWAKDVLTKWGIPTD